MNMLIGVLCEVVSAVARTEKETIEVSFVKEKMQAIVNQLDQDRDGRMTKKEFMLILDYKEAIEALHAVGVDVVGLIDSVDSIFPEDDSSLEFYDFMETVLELRGSNGSTVKDIVDLRKMLHDSFANIEKEVQTRFQCVSDRLAALEQHSQAHSRYQEQFSAELHQRARHFNNDLTKNRQLPQIAEEGCSPLQKKGVTLKKLATETSADKWCSPPSIRKMKSEPNLESGLLHAETPAQINGNRMGPPPTLPAAPDEELFRRTLPDPPKAFDLCRPERLQTCADVLHEAVLSRCAEIEQQLPRLRAYFSQTGSRNIGEGKNSTLVNSGKLECHQALALGDWDALALDCARASTAKLTETFAALGELRRVQQMCHTSLIHSARTVAVSEVELVKPDSPPPSLQTIT
jgi:hypothetical protein